MRRKSKTLLINLISCIVACSAVPYLYSLCSPVYSYDRVMNEVDQLRSVLVDITQGKLLSEFQRKMLEGSKKERSQLKVAPKAGPLAKWSTSKVS